MESNKIDQKKDLLDEILKLREDLKEKNDMINDLGSSISFIHLFIVPLIVATIVTFITMKLSLFTSNQSAGCFIITFIICLAFSTFLNKNRLNKRKKELVEQRLALQKQLVAKGKELRELEKTIAN
ncbi:hypothetical protein [Anaerococcus nagyae]|uniref:hypothetical protein n=1 Tax=Anaerococcus nagyae TaxID=1755241 RepID=UPI00373697B5